MKIEINEKYISSTYDIDVPYVEIYDKEPFPKTYVDVNVLRIIHDLNNDEIMFVLFLIYGGNFDPRETSEPEYDLWAEKWRRLVKMGVIKPKEIKND